MIQHNISLLEHNTFGIQATAHTLVTYDSVEALREALAYIHAEEEGRPLLHIGCGSNLLFLCDYKGVILKSCIKGIRLLRETDEAVWVEVGGGEVCDEFIAEAIRRGWYGMENLSLVPGQVGAAAVQNIGAYGVEVCDLIESVRGVSLADGTARTWQQAECRYGYRESIFKGELWGRYAITHVVLRLARHFTPRLQYGGLTKAVQEAGLTPETLTAGQLRQIIIDIRKAKLPDPAVLGNAGSFFKNPVIPADQAERLLTAYPAMPHYPAPDGRVKLAAGWLIEQAGWKGKSLGPAAVHKNQALILVNTGGATGRDIADLCEAVRADVKAQFGIELSPEVNFIG